MPSPCPIFSQLSAVVYLFSKHVHDPTLPLATQTLAVRVLLHLVDSICRNASSEEGLQQVGLIGFQLFVYVSCQISYKREDKISKGRVRGDCAMNHKYLTRLFFSRAVVFCSGSCKPWWRNLDRCVPTFLSSVGRCFSVGKCPSYQALSSPMSYVFCWLHACHIPRYIFSCYRGAGTSKGYGTRSSRSGGFATASVSLSCVLCILSLSSSLLLSHAVCSW